MNNCYFITFADSRYIKTLRRIEEEARRSEFFLGVYCFTEKNLDSLFIKKHGNFIENNKRGFGYFIWKPQVILQIMSIIPENSFLLYADAGCSIKKEGLNRFRNYIDIANQNNVLSFFMRGMKECQWTKMDVLKRLNFISEEEVNSDQHIGTAHLWKKTNFSKEFLKHYLEICEYYPNIDDSPSVSSNHPEFNEHRHDQSVFSILIKKMAF